MVKRFLSRKQAQEDAISRRCGNASVEYRPKGYPYRTFEEAFKLMNKPAATWTYHSPDCIQGTMVVMHIPTPGKPEYSVLGKHKGIWYADFPEPPYLLYQRYEWGNADTVYVCEGERTADVIEGLGLPATTSLGGPFKAELSDWRPVKGKNVVILSDYDDKGWDYAREVAQLCLGAGARSARIVMFPGLKVGEGPTEWVDHVTAEMGSESVLGELEKLVAAAEPAVYVPPAPKPRKGPRLDLQCLSDVEPVSQEWIFESVVPRGELTLLIGDPNSGKSRLALQIAAGVTMGIRTIHDEEEFPPAAVILFSPEEGLGASILPELEAAGADLSLIHSLEAVRDVDERTGEELEWTFQLHRDLPILEAELAHLKDQGDELGLIVIDPIDHFLGTAKESKETNWNEVSMQLRLLARKFDVAIILVSHLPNAVIGGRLCRTIRRSINTKEFAATARSVWMVIPDLVYENRRLLLPCKTNITQNPMGLAFWFKEDHIEWGDEPIFATADEFLKMAEKQKREEKDKEKHTPPTGKLGEAIDFLADTLRDGRVLATTIKHKGRELGISIRTLWRALVFLDGQSKKAMESGQFYWGLSRHWHTDDPQAE